MDDDIITIDPIEEIYAIRQRISARYDHDPDRLFQAMVERQKIAVAQGRKVVSFASPAYPSIPADTGVLRACESKD